VFEKKTWFSMVQREKIERERDKRERKEERERREIHSPLCPNDHFE